MRGCYLSSLLLISMIVGPASVTASTIQNKNRFGLPVRLQHDMYQRPSQRLPILRPLQQATISIRGGDGGVGGYDSINQIAKDAAAMAACLFFMGQSSTTWLAPHRTCIKYGLTTSLLNVSCNRKLATAYMASAVIMYGMLFQNCSPATAVGAAAVVWMLEQLKARLHYEAEQIGRPVTGEYWVALFATITAWACLSPSSGAGIVGRTITPAQVVVASIAMKLSAALILANGIAFFVSPARMCKVWGIPIGVTAPPGKKKEYVQQMKEYNESIFLHRYMGVAIVFSGIMQAVLAWGRDIYQAIGYSFGWLFMINCWSFLKTSDFKRLMAGRSFAASVSFNIEDLKKRLAYFFFPMFNLVVSCTCLLLENEGRNGRDVPSKSPVVP